MYKVYVDFTKPKNKIFPIFSYIVRFVQNTPYSHVRLRWYSRSGIEIVYEASGSSVKLLGKKSGKIEKAKIIKSYEIKVSVEEYRKLISLFEYASVSYGFLQILGIGIAHLFNLKKNPFADKRKSQVCSELLGLFLKKVKNWPVDFDLDIAGPREIDEFLQKHPEVKKVP